MRDVGQHAGQQGGGSQVVLAPQGRLRVGHQPVPAAGVVADHSGRRLIGQQALDGREGVGRSDLQKRQPGDRRGLPLTQVANQREHAPLVGLGGFLVAAIGLHPLPGCLLVEVPGAQQALVLALLGVAQDPLEAGQVTGLQGIAGRPLGIPAVVVGVVFRQILDEAGPLVALEPLDQTAGAVPRFPVTPLVNDIGPPVFQGLLFHPVLHQRVADVGGLVGVHAEPFGGLHQPRVTPLGQLGVLVLVGRGEQAPARVGVARPRLELEHVECRAARHFGRPVIGGHLEVAAGHGIVVREALGHELEPPDALGPFLIGGVMAEVFALFPKQVVGHPVVELAEDAGLQQALPALGPVRAGLVGLLQPEADDRVAVRLPKRLGDVPGQGRHALAAPGLLLPVAQAVSQGPQVEVLLAHGDQAHDFRAELVLAGRVVQQPLDRRRCVILVRGRLGNQLAQRGPALRLVLHAVAVHPERQRVAEVTGLSRVLADGAAEHALALGQLGRLVAAGADEHLRVGVARRFDAQQVGQHLQPPRLVAGAQEGVGEVALDQGPVFPMGIGAEIVAHERLDVFGRRAGRVHAPDLFPEQIGVVAEAPCLAQGLDGVGVLPQAAVVLGHVPVQVPEELLVVGNAFFEELVAHDVALGPLVDPPPLVQCLVADVLGGRSRGELVEHLLGQLGRLLDGLRAARLRVAAHGHCAVLLSDGVTLLPVPDGPTCHGRLRPVAHALERVGQPHLDPGALGGFGVTSQELPAGGRHFLVARRGLQPVDQLAHHRRVAPVGRMRGDELLRRADQPEHAPVSVVQVHQLNQHLGGFAGGVLVLAELRFQPGRLLRDLVGRCGLGRQARRG